MTATYFDPYKVLGVTPQHSFEDIRQQFKRLVLRVHPDRPGGTAEKFDVVKRAYKMIYDSHMSKRQFDRRSSMNYESYTAMRNQGTNLPRPSKTLRDFNELFELQRKPDDDGREEFLRSTEKQTPLPIAIISDPQGWTNMCDETSACNANGERCRADDYSTYCKPGERKKVHAFDIKHAYQEKESVEKMGNSRSESQLTAGASEQYASQRDKERYERQFTPYRMI